MESQKNSKFIEGKKTACSALVFHHAGGNSAHYLKILRPILDHANLVLVDLPGRYNEFDEIELSSFFDHLKLEIEHTLGHKLLIFGHSMGALTGFEFARYLLKQGINQELIHLVLSGYRAPHLEFRVKEKKISNIDMEEFKEFFGKSPLIPEEIKKHKDFFEYFMRILKRDLSFLENYHYQDSGPVPLSSSLFIPIKDTLAPKKDQLLWSNIFTEPPSVKYFDGDHFYLFEKPETFVDKIIDITKNI